MAAPVRTVISPDAMCRARVRSTSSGSTSSTIGSTPLIVADDLVWGLVGHDVEASLKAADLPLHREKFNGIPSAGRSTGSSA